jgi:hypothetical protein
MPETLTFDVYEEPRWKWLAGPTAVMALGAACLGASVSLYWVGILAALLVGYLRAKMHDTSGRIRFEVTGGELVVKGRPKVSGKRLLDVRRGGEPEQLVLTGDDGTRLEVRARTEKEASAVLAAVRRPGTVVAGRVPAFQDLIALAATTLVLSVAIVFVAPPIAWALALAAPAAIAAWVRNFKEVVAGKDGIAIHSRREHGRRRFISYADIARVTDDAVVTKDGEVVNVVPDLFLAAFDPSSRASARELVEEIRRGVAEAEASPRSAEPNLESALAGAVASHEAGFRETSIPNEDLWRLLERHDTPLETRTRAAELLRLRVPPEEVRIRVAELALSSARQETREALLRVASEEEEEADAEAIERERGRLG